MRVLVTEFRQESNSFNPIGSSLEFWKQSGIYEGDQVRQAWGDKPCAVAGMLSALDETPDVEVVLGLVMSCQSGGIAEQSVMDYYWEWLEKTLRCSLPFDGIFLSFHGALVTEDFDDPEAEITRRVREIVGDTCVIAISTDLHGYISKELVDNANIVCGYHTYPHIDFFETGYRAASLGLKAMTGQSMYMAWVPIPMIVSAAAYNTMGGAFQVLMEYGKDLVSRGELLDFSVYQMQPWIDISQPNSAALAIASDQDTAKKYALDLAERLYGVRHDFVVNQYSIDDVIDLALDKDQAKPVILVDSADSCNAGASGDNMAAAQMILARGSTLKAATVVNDRAAANLAHSLGVGAQAEFTVGGGLDPRSVSITGMAIVRSLHDGVFLQEGPAGRGFVIRIGKTARLTFGNLDVLVCEWMQGNGDPQLYRAHGIEPTLYDLVVVKACTSFRAGYSLFAGKICETDTPGAASSDLMSLPFTKLGTDIFPWTDDPTPTFEVIFAPTAEGNLN